MLNVEFTFDNTTGQSRDALYLCDIVLAEVLITLIAAHVPWNAESIPQLTRHSDVALYHGLSTHIEAISHQSPVAQHADPAAVSQTRVKVVTLLVFFLLFITTNDHISVGTSH